MIKLQPEQILADWPGFTVYDAETGEPVEAADVAMIPCADGYFAMDENGELIAVIVDSWHDTEAVVIPKEGRYLIQFADSCKYLAW